MTESRKDSEAPNPEAAVLALTREIPNYAERVADAVGCSPSELWALVLAASGRMAYAEPTAKGERHVVKLGVPDAVTGDGRTRFEVWSQALIQVVDILGDPEARYRTGHDSAALLRAVGSYFAAELPRG